MRSSWLAAVTLTLSLALTLTLAQALTLRSSSLAPVDEKPAKPGELLTKLQHWVQKGMTLWEVHKGMGGAAGPPFAAVLRREFPSITPSELTEIQAAVQHKERRQSFSAQVARARPPHTNDRWPSGSPNPNPNPNPNANLSSNPNPNPNTK